VGERAYHFDPAAHEAELVPLLGALQALEGAHPQDGARLRRRHPRAGGGFFTASQLLAAYRALAPRHGWGRPPEEMARLLRARPVRSGSGVAVVAVLTRPHPCPGQCCFCPRLDAMPTSYLPEEPGAQRAVQQGFDPARQVAIRLAALAANGHPVDKVELSILGGSWDAYPSGYRRWFVERCLATLNRWNPGSPPPDRDPEADGEAGWEEVDAARRANATAPCRCVGLTVETRPDLVTAEGLEPLRRLGVTRVQLGYQSLDDTILARSGRGHTVAASRRATELLRRAGFKVLAHWMPNLPGATPESDRADFARLFADLGLRPDDLKIYPCVLLPGTPLEEEWRRGQWRPYTPGELLDLLADCLAAVPPYCRVARVVRDVPAPAVLAGNRRSNLRQEVEHLLARQGRPPRDIRARELRQRPVEPGEVAVISLRYPTSAGGEEFVQALTPEGHLVGFARLTLPRRPAPLAELEGAALLREVHVYGVAATLRRRDGTAQHRGVGRRLVERAAELARQGGFERLAVISAPGTTEYYRKLGFADGALYQHLELAPARGRCPGGHRDPQG
jgi:elongator complex protein 3